MYFQIMIHYFKMNSYFKMNREYRLAWKKVKDSAKDNKKIEKDFKMEDESESH